MKQIYIIRVNFHLKDGVTIISPPALRDFPENFHKHQEMTMRRPLGSEEYEIYPGIVTQTSTWQIIKGKITKTKRKRPHMSIEVEQI